MKIDKAAYDYYNRLTSFLYQFRMIANNYNQTVKAVHTNFNERRAAALLSRLEKATAELTEKRKKVIGLTEDFTRKW